MSKELDKVILPGKCILIKRDKPLEQTASGIFLGEDTTEVIDTGVIVKIGIGTTMSLINSKWKPVGTRVRFREAFGEIIMIDNEEYLFFRELEPSIYYYIDEKD